MTPTELELELAAWERQEFDADHPETDELKELEDERERKFIEFVRSLPTPPTVVLHPSEYPARAPKYTALDLPHMQEHTIEDLRHRNAKGRPIRILDPENIARRNQNGT